jgi:hypothetical protein
VTCISSISRLSRSRRLVHGSAMSEAAYENSKGLRAMHSDYSTKILALSGTIRTGRVAADVIDDDNSPVKPDLEQIYGVLTIRKGIPCQSSNQLRLSRIFPNRTPIQSLNLSMAEGLPMVITVSAISFEIRPVAVAL